MGAGHQHNDTKIQKRWNTDKYSMAHDLAITIVASKLSIKPADALAEDGFASVEKQYAKYYRGAYSAILKVFDEGIAVGYF